MSNKDVITAWGNGKPAHSQNLSTDGNRLYSYALCIGEWRDGLPVVFNYTARADMNPFGHRVPSEGFYSMTTSHHVSLARRVGYAFQKDGREPGAQEALASSQRRDAKPGKHCFCGCMGSPVVGDAFERCCCSDPDCPIGHAGDCREPATTALIRVDDADGSRLPFCDACAEDAFGSGIFASVEGS